MGVSGESISELLLSRIAATPSAVAFLVPQGKSWTPLRWSEVGEKVRDLALGLRALGLKDEERCSIFANTSIDWILADFSILCAGGATTTIYPSNTPADTCYIVQDSGSVMVFAENEEQVAKLRIERSQLPDLKKVITFEGKGSDDGWVITMDQLAALGRAARESGKDTFEQHARAVKRDSLATLVYTSGTTGKPKGVELIHDCWVYEAEAVDSLGLLRQDDLQYLWLPLSHVFGKVLQAAQLKIGFTTAVDGKVDRMVENLSVVRPTFVAAVPRIFEKVYNRVVGSAQEGGAVKYAIFKWAVSVGKKVSVLTRSGKSVGPILAAQHAVAKKLVFQKIQDRFGGRLHFFVSGSAPMSAELAEFFHAVGILVLEGYGLTETSAATCVNLPNRFRFGTVGPPLPGTELKLAADGEILVRGRGTLRGYHHMPELTAEVKDAEGWVHTGDVGQIEDGFLKITDRKKDLFKTSNGKYIAPTALELKLKMISPYVSQVLIHGENRNFVTALLALDAEAIQKWASGAGLQGKSYTEIVRSPQARSLLESSVKTLNEGLANYEQVKKFAILDEDLTLENGALTPSLKLKRKAVETRFRSLLDGFYQASRE
jgi:long-chain acyl-CoA synthetase